MGGSIPSLTLLQEVRDSQAKHYFVKKLVAMALDGNARECEMASGLLSALYSVVRPLPELLNFQ